MLNHITMFQPSAIDNAFSTLQIIHKLIKHMNKVIDEVNSIDSKANEYTDEQIRLAKNELNTRIDEVVLSITELETELKQFARDYTDTQIDDLKNEYIHNKLVEVYEAIENVNDRLTTLYERLDIKIDRTKNELEYLIETTKAELIELIKKGNSLVYSGYNGLRTSLQDEISKNVYNVVGQMFGITWDLLHSKYWGRYNTSIMSNVTNNLKVTFSNENFDVLIKKDNTTRSYNISATTWDNDEPCLAISIYFNNEISDITTKFRAPYLENAIILNNIYMNNVLTIYIPLSQLDLISTGTIIVLYVSSTLHLDFSFGFANNNYENYITWNGLQTYLNVSQYKLTYNQLPFLASFKYNIGIKVTTLTTQQQQTISANLFEKVVNIDGFFAWNAYTYSEPDVYNNQVWANKQINSFFN